MFILDLFLQSIDSVQIETFMPDIKMLISLILSLSTCGSAHTRTSMFVSVKFTRRDLQFHYYSPRYTGDNYRQIRHICIENSGNFIHEVCKLIQLPRKSQAFVWNMSAQLNTNKKKKESEKHCRRLLCAVKHSAAIIEK